MERRRILAPGPGQDVSFGNSSRMKVRLSAISAKGFPSAWTAM